MIVILTYITEKATEIGQRDGVFKCKLRNVYKFYRSVILTVWFTCLLYLTFCVGILEVIRMSTSLKKNLL